MVKGITKKIIKEKIETGKQEKKIRRNIQIKRKQKTRKYEE